MASDVGIWNCRWEFLDEQQNIVSAGEGTQTVSFVIEGVVQQLFMDAPFLDTQSVTHRFFHKTKQVLFWTSVDRHGDLWEFVEDMDGGFSYSLPHDDGDGTQTWLRFSSLRETPDEVDVLMELSKDEAHWIPIFRMFRVRQKTESNESR